MLMGDSKVFMNIQEQVNEVWEKLQFQNLVADENREKNKYGHSVLIWKQYISRKPYVSSFQYFKDCAIWSFLEEVMTILLKSVQAGYRIPKMASWHYKSLLGFFHGVFQNSYMKSLFA